jgi:hypothetical protein
MRPKHFVLVATLGAAMGMSAAQSGERTYRWTDEKGRVHYSDVKSSQGEQVQIKPGSGISSAPQDTPESIAQRQQNCQRKKDQFTVYSNSEEITETDSLGRTRSYNDYERLQLIQRAKLQMQQACAEAGEPTDVTDDAP